MNFEDFAQFAKKYFLSVENEADFFLEVIRKLRNKTYVLAKREIELPVRPEILEGLGLPRKTEQLFKTRATFRFTSYDGLLFNLKTGSLGGLEDLFFNNGTCVALYNPGTIFKSILEHVKKWMDGARENRTRFEHLGINAFGLGGAVLLPLKGNLVLVASTYCDLDVYVVQLPDDRPLSSDLFESMKQVLNGRIKTFRRQGTGGTDAFVKFLIRPPHYFLEDVGINRLEWQYWVPKGIWVHLDENPGCLERFDSERVGLQVVNVNGVMKLTM